LIPAQTIHPRDRACQSQSKKELHRRDAEYAEIGVFFNKNSLLRALSVSAVSPGFLSLERLEPLERLEQAPAGWRVHGELYFSRQSQTQG
jgi:hypothetical protein